MDDFDPAQVRSYRTISRRRLLQGTVAGAISLHVLGAPNRWLNQTATAATPVALDAAATCPRFGSGDSYTFDTHTFNTLAAVAAQLIPTDDTPGASEACTTSFVELNATGNAGLAGLLAGGVVELDAAANALQPGATFIDLGPEDQIDILQQFEAGTAPSAAQSHAEVSNFVVAAGQAVPTGLQQIRAMLAMPVSPSATMTPNVVSSSFQQVFFNTYRSLTKLAWVINWPEAFVRDPVSGQPFFSDAEHLISDPDIDSTGTCWTVIKYHVIDYEVERLLWAWQAGLNVIGFEHGWPKFHSKSLKTKERLAARDELYRLSNLGVA